MANSPDSVDSWPGFLAQLNKTFLLIRDIFGYALPGGVFLAIGIISGSFSLDDVQTLLDPFKPPWWAVLILSVGTCYVAGDIMASIAYLPIANWKWLQSRTPWIAKKTKWKWLEKRADHIAKLLETNPTEVTGSLLEIRERHAEFFAELDRRETLMLLSGSTAVALLGGWAVFYCYKPQPSRLFLIGGIILVIQFLTGPSHLRRVRDAIGKANELADATAPTIQTVFPPSGRVDEDITLEIVGTNLKSTKAVRLSQSGAPVQGTDITTSAMMVHCKIRIPSGAVGNWSVVVQTEAGETKESVLFTAS